MQVHTPCWAPPLASFVKVNVDAGLNSITMATSFAVVAHDSSGIVCFCTFAKGDNRDSSFQAEVKAILF